MSQTKPIIFIRDAPGQRGQVLDVAIEAERRGFMGVMSPSSGDNIALSLAVLERTERIIVGTGIANIYTRHPAEMASAASLIEELHPGRFILGIGVSHRPTHERLGVDTGKPLADTREYVAGLREEWDGNPHPTLMLAALRKRMTALAGEISEGVMWAQGIRSHMAFSLSQLPDGLPEDFIVSNVARTCVSDDKDAAREVIRRSLDSYMRLPNYQNYFIEAGYKDEVSSARTAVERGDDTGVLQAISDHFLDDVALFGTASEVREQFAAWVEAGVNHMALNPTSATDPARAPYEVMDAFS